MGVSAGGFGVGGEEGGGRGGGEEEEGGGGFQFGGVHHVHDSFGDKGAGTGGSECCMEGGGGDGGEEMRRDGENRFGGEECGESGGGGVSGRGVFGVEKGAEAMEGAGDAFVGGVFGDAEGCADLFEGLIFEEFETEGGAVEGGEAGEGGVEAWGEFGPGGCGGGCDFTSHGGDPLFVVDSALAEFDGVAGAEVGDFDEPPAEGWLGAKRGGFACEDDEDGLGDVFDGGGVADLAAGGGVDEREVALNERSEGGLVARGEVGGEELGVVFGDWGCHNSRD